MSKIETKLAVIDDLHHRLDGAVSKRDIEAVYDNVLEQIAHQLQTHAHYRFGWIGAFEAQNAPARKGRNPQTGESIEIKARNRVRFRPGKRIKDRVNGGV